MRFFLTLLLIVSISIGANAASTTSNATSILLDSELRPIYLADQADRQRDVIQREGKKVYERDRARLKRVTELLQAGRIKTAQDYWYAAIIFQHGHNTEEYRIAYSLALIASVLKPQSESAQRLKASTWDRLMLSTNQPQWYGTQYDISPEGKWSLSNINPNIISDEERRQVGISLEKVYADIEEKNKKIENAQ